MVDTYDQHYQMDLILYWMYLVFILVFLIEFILKIIGLRKHYFRDWWNILDFVVLCLTILGMFSFGDVIAVCDYIIVTVELWTFNHYNHFRFYF